MAFVYFASILPKIRHLVIRQFSTRNFLVVIYHISVCGNLAPNGSSAALFFIRFGPWNLYIRNLTNKIEKRLLLLFFYRTSEMIRMIIIESEWIIELPQGWTISSKPSSHICPAHLSKHWSPVSSWSKWSARSQWFLSSKRSSP